VTGEALGELEAVTSTKDACALLGLARASVYRARAPRMHGPRPEPAAQSQPSALDAAERAEIVAALDDDRFTDKSPAQVWAVVLDEGRYLGSISTIYRVLRSCGQVGERRAQASHPARVRPELVADGPDQVWSWDITKLKGPFRGVYFDAFVMLDIYSRKVVHWEVHATENGELAKAFIENAFAENGGVMPATVHSDNGTSMTSNDVAGLLANLHIERSRSRPKVSNDNPYSEAAFKTLKYCPAFPENFASVYDSRDFARTFFVYYNTEHRHSGIGLYTPGSVHDGSWKHVRDRRQVVLDAAYSAHPERFHRGPPRAAELPRRVWINQPPSKIESQEDQPTTATA
jgi:putative transposase